MSIRFPPAAGDRFGWSVAVSGSRVVVGTVLDNHDNGLEDTGSAYLFDLTGAFPSVPEAKLDNPTPAAFEQFGFAVAISGSHVVIGARFDNTGASESGSVYIYDLTRPVPAAPIATLTNPSPAMFDNFGFSVAISDQWVVVGAVGDRTGAFAAGSAYVYPLAAISGQTPFLTLTNPSPVSADYFGWSVALSGTRILVGAPYDDSGATDAGSVYAYELTNPVPTVPVRTLTKPSLVPGLAYGFATAISGTRFAVSAAVEGAVRVYDLNRAGTPSPVLTVTNPQAGRTDSFGMAVALSGTSLVVGAPDADRSYVYDLSSLNPAVPAITLTNPGPRLNDNFGAAVGVSGSRIVVGAWISERAYVFDTSVSTPSIPVLTLTNSLQGAGNRFGASVAIEGVRVVVGALLDRVGGTLAGAVYLYDLAGPTPAEPSVVVPNPVPGGSDLFGQSLSMSGTRLVIGAPGDSASGATGPNGPIGSGAAFVFDLNNPESLLSVLTLPNPDPALYDSFGWSVGISESLVVVGAFADDLGAADTGGAYVYDLASAVPNQPVANLRHPDSRPGAAFGRAVAIHGATIVVGAPFDDSEAEGRGAAYVFGVPPRLYITPSSPGFITLSWKPSSSAGFFLQHADEVASANWMDSPSGTTNPVQVLVGRASQVYRLIGGAFDTWGWQP